MGLDVIEQLRPVTFDWKESGEADLGLVAEEVAKVAPLLTTRNAGGQIEGVKYDHINAVLVKAVQEQQEQIEDLEARLAALEQSQPGSAAALGADSPTGSAWLPIFAVTSALLLLAAGALLGILVAPRLGRRRAAEGDA